MDAAGRIIDDDWRDVYAYVRIQYVHSMRNCVYYTLWYDRLLWPVVE